MSAPLFAYYPIYILLETRMASLNPNCEELKHITDVYEQRYPSEFRKIIAKSLSIGELSPEDDNFLREYYGITFFNGYFMSILNKENSGIKKKKKKKEDKKMVWEDFQKNPSSDIVQLDTFTRFYCNRHLKIFFYTGGAVMRCLIDNSFFLFDDAFAKVFKPEYHEETLYLPSEALNLKFLPPKFRTVDSSTGAILSEFSLVEELELISRILKINKQNKELN